MKRKEGSWSGRVFVGIGRALYVGAASEKTPHLHDDAMRDRFCGMPVFNGTPCRVTPLDD